MSRRKLGRDIMMVGFSDALLKIDCRIEKAAIRDELVSIQGEIGTGKELVAHAIHLLSARQGQPLITVNCAALPRELAESSLFGHVKGAFTGATQDRRGYFEEADRGTIFLDEIGELDLKIQAKLLRVIETGELQKLGESRTRKRVDVRVLVATSRDLKQMAREGTFNEALLSRLDALRIQVPPLRERKEDIPHLVTYFLGKFAGSESALTVSTEVMEVFRKYHWPHNVRELRNMVARLATFSDGPTIDFKDLHEECPEIVESVQAAENKSNAQGLTRRTPCQQARAIAEEHERRQLVEVLIKHDWNITRAAKELNTYQQYVSKRMKRLGIKKPSQKK